VAELTGVLQADFSDFYSAVTKAETHLRDFETGAGKVESSLNRMVDSFSGRKLIQDATYAAQAIERLGGASKLTERELAGAAAQAAEAAEKLRALGKEVPPEIEKLAHAVRDVGDETAAVEIKTDSLTQQYQQFDGVLSAAGINLGRQVKAIEDLGAAAGKGGAGLSLFAKAGLVAGAAMVGWEIGKKIDEWTGLSKAIGDATAAALGWTTAAGGAGSATDTLRRASEIAKREITDFAEATRIIRAEIDKLQAASMRAQGPAILAKELAGYRAELVALERAGVLGAVTAALEGGIIPQQRIIDQYHVSAEALKILSERLEHTRRAQDAHTESVNKALALQDQIFGRELIGRAQEFATALGDASQVSRLLPEQMATMHTTFAGAADQLERLGKGSGETARRMRELADATAAVDSSFVALEVAGVEASINWMGTATDINAATESIIPPIQDATEGWDKYALSVNKAMLEWDKVNPELEGTTATISRQTEVIRQQIAVVQQSAATWRAYAESLRADAERMEKSGGGLSTTMWQGQYIENLRTGAARALDSASRQSELDARVAGIGAKWGGGGGWTINVNAQQGINGEQIASELVSSMRRRGISPGGL